MLAVLSRYWWILLVRGVAAILFGIIALINPAMTLEVLVAVLGAYLLVDGIFTIIAAVQRRAANPSWGLMALEGVISVLAGIGTFFYPGLTALLLLNLVAFWAIFRGVFEIAAAIRLRKEIQGEFWLGLGGLASVVFGVLLLAFPGDGLLTLLWLMGVFAIAFGVFMVMLSLRVRKFSQQHQNA